MKAFELTNGREMRVRFLEIGGIITSIEVPDRDGKAANVVLAYETPDEYAADTAYLGALIGRYANRIAGAAFTLDGTLYPLPANDATNHLHGGRSGFNRARWRVAARRQSATLEYTSPDGEEGYPGTLEVSVTYVVTEASELRIDYRAKTDAPTHVNLTQHSYFNLSGVPDGDILDHELTLHADHFTPVTNDLIPTGEIRSVRGTPFDFTRPARIGHRIDADDDQLTIGAGYDHNFVLSGTGLRPAATLRDPVSGRVMEITTTEPGIQFYSGNKLSLALPTGMGNPHIRRGGLALETQHFPDSPNRPEFPSTVLRPGEIYESRTIYRFSTD